MADVFSQIISYFREEYKHFEVDDEHQSVRMQIQADSVVLKTRVQWDAEKTRVSFWVRDIMTIPELKREVACVLINLINWGLAIADFEMDMEDGELMVNLTFFISDGTLGHEQIDDNLGTIINIANRFYPVFQKVIWADMSPKEALAMLDK